MNTLFEFRQIGQSWGEEDFLEIKIFEDGSLVYKVVDNHMMNCFTEQKKPNKKLADDIAFLIYRNKEKLNDIPSELNDGSRGGYRHEVKLGEKLFYGNELKKILFYEDTLEPNAEGEDTIVQIVVLVRKILDSHYPNFIDWDAISTQWFKTHKFSNYKFDGHYYCIEDDKRIVEYDDDANATEITAFSIEQLRMYGKCTDPWCFEMKVLSIKTFEAPDWKALITAEDGAGIELAFWDINYFDHPENYEVGKIGVYSIYGDIELIPAPEKQLNGLWLRKDEEEKYSDYIAGEKSTRGKKIKYVNDLDFAIFEKTEDFENTGLYNFRTVINSPYYGENENGEPDDEIITGFMIPLMNQIDKEYPRKISAQFDLDNPYKGQLDFGDGLKGVISFGATPWITDNVGKYGSNQSIPYSEKHPDTSEWDDYEYDMEDDYEDWDLDDDFGDDD